MEKTHMILWKIESNEPEMASRRNPILRYGEATVAWIHSSRYWLRTIWYAFMKNYIWAHPDFPLIKSKGNVITMIFIVNPDHEEECAMIIAAFVGFIEADPYWKTTYFNDLEIWV